MHKLPLENAQTPFAQTPFAQCTNPLWKMHKLPLENAQTPFPPFTCQRSPNNGRKRRGYQKDPDSGKRFWGFCFKKLEKGGSATRPSPVYRLAQTLNPKKLCF